MATSDSRYNNPEVEPPALPARTLERAGTFPPTGPRTDAEARDHKIDAAYVSQKDDSETTDPAVGGVFINTAVGGLSSYEGDRPSSPVLERQHSYPEAGLSASRESRHTKESRQQRPSNTRQDSRSHQERHSHSPESRRKTSSRPTSVLAGISGIRDRIVHSDRLEEQLIESQEKIKELQRGYDKKKKSYQKLERDFFELRADSESLRGELESKTSQIVALQGKLFHDMGHGGHMHAQDDDSIRDQIKECTDSWRSWATKYAMQHITVIKREGREDLQTLFAACSDKDQRLTVDTSITPQHADIAPRLVLHATLSKFICETIVQHPFFGLEVPTPPGFPFNAAKDMEDVYEEARKDNPPEAHLWRSQTIQFLNKYVPKNEHDKPAFGLDCKSIYYRRLAEWFDNSKSKALFRDDGNINPTQRMEDLKGILRQAGGLFARLWTQKVWITVHEIDYLKKKKFSTQSKEMEAHPSYGITDGDGANTMLDNRTVQAVIQPCIVAYGNEDGTNYDRYKVWSKAIVWVGPAAPLRRPGR